MPNRLRMIGCLRVWVPILAMVAGASSVTGSGQPDTQGNGPDEVLWREVESLTGTPPATQPYSGWFDLARSRKVRLLEKVQLYRTLYPGGAHRDRAIEIELGAMFEIATFDGGKFGPLCERVEEILGNPPGRIAEQEAAYWRIVCERNGGESTSGKDESIREVIDPALLEAYDGYVRRYPRSRHVPRLVTLLVEDAGRRGDAVVVRRLCKHLETHFAGHAAADAARAVLRRLEAVGKPFRLTGSTVDGREVHTQDWRGQPVVVVVWAGFDVGACAQLSDLECFRAANPSTRMIGVSLDETAEGTTAAIRRLRLDWPQVNDGLGWGGAFVREWGVRRLPFVFVVDRQGLLRGTAEGDGWSELVESVAGVTASGATRQGAKRGAAN